MVMQYYINLKPNQNPSKSKRMKKERPQGAQVHIFGPCAMKLKSVSSSFSLLRKGTLDLLMHITGDFNISKDSLVLIQLYVVKSPKCEMVFPAN